MLEDFDPNCIQDLEGARRAVLMLLNLIEGLKQETQRLSEENQRLRDENNRLKGEQGKPDIKASRKGSRGKDISSEKERHKRKKRKKSSKVDQIKIDREEVMEVDPAKLPPDAEFKGYEPVVVQDIKITTDNVRFLKEKYYSASEGKTYLAKLPPIYDGETGPGAKSLAITLYFAGNMTQPKILECLRSVGLRISAGQLSNILIKEQQPFHTEKDAIYKAGLRSSPWQNMDDTGTRVNGQNQYCQIVCNPLFTAYFTSEKKDRLTVLRVLQNYRELSFRVNEETYGFLDVFGLPLRLQHVLEIFPQDIDLSEAEFLALLEEHLPNLGIQQRRRVLEAAAVAAYHEQVEYPVVRLLLCDDAPQFKLIAKELALCWVHDGRHYKKLSPYVPYHQELLESFLEQYWMFYDELLEYRQKPTGKQRTELSDQFDELFSTVTGYVALDDRIAKTKAKKSSLLMVLDHPEIPLHNNAAELEARRRARKRDASFGPRTEDGKQAWDTFMTIVATAKKLGVSIYHYIYDRVSGTYEMPSLAQTITQRSAEEQLGWSWIPP